MCDLTSGCINMFSCFMSYILGWSKNSIGLLATEIYSTSVIKKQSNNSQDHVLFPLSIELIEVTLVNNIVQISGAEFHSTSSVHCIVCSPPQVKSPSIIIYPHLPFSIYPQPPPIPRNHYTLVLVSFSYKMGFYI